MATRSLRSVSMSRTSGIFSRMTVSSVRMAAAIAGRAAFLAPLMRTVPSRGLPPRMTNLSIGFGYCLSRRGARANIITREFLAWDRRNDLAAERFAYISFGGLHQFIGGG